MTRMICEIERDQLIAYIRALRAFEQVMWAEGEDLEILRHEFAAIRSTMTDTLLDEIEKW